MMANNTKSTQRISFYHSKRDATKNITLGIPRIDAFWGGFFPATTTLIDGQHFFLDQLLAIVSVKAVDTFSQPILYIDGGNSINLYQIINVSKRNHLALNHILKQILVARAFTTYQLDTLIKTLDKKIKDHSPSALIVPCITSLLLDKNIKKKEGETLLKWWLQEITQVTLEYNLISLISSRISYRNWYTRSLWKILTENVNTIVRITPKKESLLLHLIKQDRVLSYLPTPLNQSTLDEFTGEKKDG
jgi:hypothetical protein